MLAAFALAPILTLAAASPLLDEAAAALAQSDAENCGRLAQEALATGALDEADFARAWSLRGRCYALAGDADRAERAYAVVVRVSAGLADKGAALVVEGDDAFARARAAMPPAALALRARAATIEAVTDDSDVVFDAVDVELVSDDLLLARAALLLRGDEELARFPLEAGHAKHRVTGVATDGVVAVLLDKSGNALLRARVSTERERVFTPPPASASSAPTVLTTLGATAIGAGIVGIVTSGIGVAAVGADEGQIWLVGVGASTGLFLIGASLVVVDQGIGG